MRVRPAIAAMIAVLIGCAVLGVVGLGVEDKLDPLSLTIDGTGSAKGEELAKEHFGDATQFAVLLTGPQAEIERQGPPLVRAMRHMPKATVISPWDRGTVAALRPGQDKALIIVDFHVPLATAMRDTVPALDKVVEEEIHPPLTATQSGFASVSRGLQEETIDATERAELLAVPLLLLVLLIVFRSLVAAAIPLVFGALTVLAGRGVLVLLSSVMTIDAISLVVCTMMGLALGVDYSLLIVSRFREELDGGSEPYEAAMRARSTAGRTTLFAGATLLAALALSAFVQPGSLLLSLATTVGVATALSVLVAVAGLPGLLALLGRRVNAAALGRSAARPGRSWVATAASKALRRPAVAALLIAIPLILLAAPALALTTAAPGVDELPTSNEARQNAETIEEAVGPGWEAPFVLVAAAPEGPITTPERLRLLSRWQRRIARQPGVRAVIGPGPVAEGTKPLRKLGRTLTAERARRHRRPRSPRPRAARRRPRRHPAARRSRQGRGRRRAARRGRRPGPGRRRPPRRRPGTRRRRRRAGELRHRSPRQGLQEARPGAAQDRRRQPHPAARPALAGAPDPGWQPRRARSLATALAEAARTDPALRPQAREARTLARAIASSRNEAKRLRNISGLVNGSLNRISAGGKKLEQGVGRLQGASQGLTGGLERLGQGAGRLAEGLGALQGGAGALAQGLSEGFQRSRPLEVGLRRSGVRVSAIAAPLSNGVERLHRSSPGLFDSGYFVLSALEGAAPRRRALAGEAVSVRHGGQAARMLIISDYGLNTGGSREVGSRLTDDAARIARQGGLRTGLTGGAAVLNDYGSVTRARIPLVVGAVVLACFLMLVLILRAPLLAALAVILNLASVAAAIGVMALVCRIPDGWPLGGHPYVDTVGAAAIFGVTFGLSIDYAVFLLARMRESYRRDGDNRAAIGFGLEKTAGVITGAAAIMAAVFISFAAAPIATVSQMGVGLTVAILLDATVVRIVLLPALMLILGDRVWHTPKWLERALPELEHSASRPPERDVHVPPTAP